MSSDGNRLLPSAGAWPWWLLFSGVFPQLVLLLLHARAWTLVAGELGREGRGAYALLFGGQVLLLGALGLAWFYARRSSRPMGTPLSAALFVLHAGFLWTACSVSEHLVPDTVAFWMLNVGQLLFTQFALIAPLLFVTLLHLAAWQSGRIRPAVDAVLCGAILVGIPLIMILGIRVLSHLIRVWNIWGDGFSLVLFIGTAVMLLAFLRLLLWIYAWVGRRTVVMIVCAWLLPLGGLALNASIPFPCHLQDWRVYALTVINAIAVCLPFRGTGRAAFAVWMARVISYPFTLYFFLVFLPFLPLSMLAMMAAGAGFLILAPTALWVIHTRRLYDEGRALVSALGRGRVALGLACGLLVLPAVYTGRALVHRVALNQAIAVVYAPDYREARAPLNRRAAGLALHRLRRVKEGLYIPFLSEFYNRMVFNGMTLPDYKIADMERILFDRESVSKTPRRRIETEFFTMFTGTLARSMTGRNPRAMPGRDVVLAEARPEARRDGDLVRSMVTLVMTNGAVAPSEFVTEWDLPPGVVVAGFWLDVNGERVAGRIFDRKTAAWLYHMVRDEQNRDPGLLQYTGPDHVELRVFPFAAGQARECGIEFVFPVGDRPTLSIGSRGVPLAGDIEEAARPVFTATDRSSSVWIPPAVADALPAIRREPYFHFLVDVSSSAAEAYPRYADRIRHVLSSHPEIRQARVDWVDVGTTPLSEDLGSGEAVAAAVERAGPRVFAGGFWPERAVRHALTRWMADDAFTNRVPVFVLVTERPDQECPPLGSWGGWVPECDRVYDARQPIAWQGRDILLVTCGDQRYPLRTDRGGWAVFDVASPITLEGQGTFPPSWSQAARFFTNDSIYAQAAEGFAFSRRAGLRPDLADRLRAGLLNLSRTHGVLLPGTAYMVVENSAQWRTLERQEKQSLGAKGALEFDEFKEPVVVPDGGSSGWLLLVAVCVLLFTRGWLGRAGREGNPQRWAYRMDLWHE